MKFYDKEILCIPAGKTIQAIKQYHIYECPTTGRQYKSRGDMHPLYVCFRNHGRFDKLYKVQDVVVMDMNDAAAVASLEATGLYLNIQNRINGYVNDVKPSGIKFVFILDPDESIDLRPPYVFPGSTRGMAGHVFLTLKQVF